MRNRVQMVLKKIPRRVFWVAMPGCAGRSAPAEFKVLPLGARFGIFSQAPHLAGMAPACRVVASLAYLALNNLITRNQTGGHQTRGAHIDILPPHHTAM